MIPVIIGGSLIAGGYQANAFGIKGWVDKWTGLWEQTYANTTLPAYPSDAGRPSNPVFQPPLSPTDNYHATATDLKNWSPAEYTKALGFKIDQYQKDTEYQRNVMATLSPAMTPGDSGGGSNTGLGVGLMLALGVGAFAVVKLMK